MDDHSLIRAGVRALVMDIPGYAVIGEASDGSQLLEMFDRMLEQARQQIRSDRPGD